MRNSFGLAAVFVLFKKSALKEVIVMNEAESGSISEIELDDGSKALVVWLSSDPMDLLAVFAPDISEDSSRLLVELEATWASLWPNIRMELENGIRDYEIGQPLEPEACVAFVSRTQPNEYKSDVSDIHLRLDFGDGPVWDSFIRGTSVAHFQAVF